MLLIRRETADWVTSRIAAARENPWLFRWLE
jgi:hypothetical protein